MNDQRVLEVEQKSPVSEEDNLIIDTVNKFLERDVKPFVKEFESEDKYPQLIADKPVSYTQLRAHETLR